MNPHRVKGQIHLKFPENVELVDFSRIFLARIFVQRFLNKKIRVVTFNYSDINKGKLGLIVTIQEFHCPILILNREGNTIRE